MANISFKTSTRSVLYGDQRTFIEYKILMFSGAKLVGLEDGPRRGAETRKAALQAARQRITVLRSHRLFAIHVTRKHISDGEARNCNNCAIAQALWHNQERMGLPKREFSFEVNPYGCFTDPSGIVLRSRDDDSAKRLPVEALPEIVFGKLQKHIFSEPMQEWAMAWDDWAESRHMPLHEWREEYNRDEDDHPHRPSPCSFVLDLDMMTNAEDAAA